MREEAIYGGALIASAIGMLLTAAFHPTGHQMMASAEAFARVAPIGVAVHTLALGSTGLAMHGLIGLSRHLGVARPDVVAALVAFAMSVVGTIIAASASGFIAPMLGKMMFAADEASRPLVRHLFYYNSSMNQTFAKFHTVAAGLAIMLWSFAMRRRRFDGALGIVGMAIGALIAGTILTGGLTLNVRGFGLVVLIQSVWIAWAGVLLMMRSRSVGGAARDEFNR